MESHSLQIERLHLSDVGPFSELILNFEAKPGLNLLCGSNGIGKTTILEAIVASFSQGRNHRLKRRQSAEKGAVNISYLLDSENRKLSLEIMTFHPENGDLLNYRYGFGENVINVRASRDFSYLKQSTISRDPDFNPKYFGQNAAQDLNSSEIKSWLTNRYLLKPHADKSSWTPHMISNLEVAEKLFSILDKNVKLAEVDVRTFDVLVSTPSGTIPFEFLSSGFRSAFSLLLGILKEIEFRKLNVSADSFSGIILIDEIDLHLHPTWQQEIGKVLKRTFPKAQIIATTHSPHVIQTAQPDEVISLQLEDGGKVTSRTVPSSKFGYLGWTIEEVLEDIMGVEDTRTSVFRKAIREFDAAIDEESNINIQHALKKLDEMLHPKNPLRKYLRIQAAPFIDESPLKGGAR